MGMTIEVTPVSTKEFPARLRLTVLIGLLNLLFWQGSLTGQEGTLYFATLLPRELDYPVMDCNGPLSGAGWTAQIWIGPAHSSEAQLVPLTPSTTFRTDIPGYVLPVELTAGRPGA